MPKLNRSIDSEIHTLPAASKLPGEEMMSEVTRQVGAAISGAEYVYLNGAQCLLRVPCDAGRDLQFSQQTASEIWDVGVVSGPPKNRELHPLDPVRIASQNPRDIAREIIRLCAHEFTPERMTCGAGIEAHRMDRRDNLA